MNKEKYIAIFIVVNYRSEKELESFINDTKKLDFSNNIIVVNNHYSLDDDFSIKKLCEVHQVEFLSSENKGYSYGNNLGIQYAKSKFLFDFIIISNPDIKIIDLNLDVLKTLDKGSITGPKIITSKRKNQNPFYYKRIKLSEFLVYKGFKNNNRMLLYIGIFINKIARNINRLINPNLTNVYGLHGSFLIFHSDVFKKINPVFDDNVFLYCEENILSITALKYNVTLVYNPNIGILHYQDASTKYLKSQNSILKKSYLYYYENYVKEPKK